MEYGDVQTATHVVVNARFNLLVLVQPVVPGLDCLWGGIGMSEVDSLHAGASVSDDQGPSDANASLGPPAKVNSLVPVNVWPKVGITASTGGDSLEHLGRDVAAQIVERKIVCAAHRERGSGQRCF